MNSVRAILLATMVSLGSSARAEFVNATLLSDTFIASNDANTNFSTGRFLQMRSVSTVTRSAFVQFRIPAMNPALITDAALTLRSASNGSGFPNVEIVATGNAVDLTLLTWNSAISSGLLTGTGREADFTMAWSNDWDQFSTPLVLGTVDASTPVGGTIIPYQSSGLTDFLKSQANPSQAVVVTLAMGFAAAETTSAGMQFRAVDDAGGIYAPTLQIQVVPVPEPSAGMLLLVSALVAGWGASSGGRVLPRGTR